MSSLHVQCLGSYLMSASHVVSGNKGMALVWICVAALTGLAIHLKEEANESRAGSRATV